MNWFHKFFNPHCEHCHDEYLDDMICDSCNTLRQENAALRKHNDQLIQSLLEIVKPVKPEVIQQPIETVKPVNTGMNWRAHKHMLETEDKQAAEILRRKNVELDIHPINKSVDELEQELEIHG